MISKVQPSVKIVGLGPGDERYLLESTKKLLDDSLKKNCLILRTGRHPAAVTYVDNGAITLDSIYDISDDRQVIYGSIADFVVKFAKQHGEAVYAVPGSPAVGEDSVSILLNRKDEVKVDLVVGMSFLDLLFIKLGLDPIAGSVSIIDGEQFEIFGVDKSGPVVITQTYSSQVLSKIKLTVSDAFDLMNLDEITAVVLYHLGLDDEAVFEVGINDLDKEILTDKAGTVSVVADHLTSVYVDLPVTLFKMVADLKETVAELRQKCPWDKKQTFESLTKHVVEECYELVDAARNVEVTQDYNNLVEELGDLLFFVFIYSQIGEEHGAFNLNDIILELNAKLIARHPHVFKEIKDVNLNQFLRNWELDKVKEKNRDSIFDGIPTSLPGLNLLSKILKKSAASNIDVLKNIPESDLSSTEKILLELTQHNDDLESVARDLALKIKALAVITERSNKQA